MPENVCPPSFETWSELVQLPAEGALAPSSRNSWMRKKLLALSATTDGSQQGLLPVGTGGLCSAWKVCPPFWEETKPSPLGPPL